MDFWIFRTKWVNINLIEHVCYDSVVIINHITQKWCYCALDNMDNLQQQVKQVPCCQCIGGCLVCAVLGDQLY